VNSNFLKLQSKHSLLALVFLVCIGHFNAQIPDYYDPFPVVKISSTVSNSIKNGHEKSKLKLPNTYQNKETAEFTKAQFEKRQEFLLSLLKSGDFLINTPINSYVERVFKSVLAANPSIDQTMAVLVSRNPRPNAFNTGDNLIIVHLGLLERISNEAELAFVLCHEIAHQTQNHVTKDLISRASLFYSDSVQQEIAKIKKTEYFVLSRLNNFILPGLRSSMAFSRRDEFEADSIGFNYYIQTGYDKAHALSLINLLATFDTDRDTSAIDYKKIFSHPEYPYNLRWDYIEEVSSLGSFETDEEVLEEEKQLQSHPDTPLRFERIQNTVPSQPQPNLLPSDEETKNLHLDVRLQIMNDHIQRNNYGKAMHHLCYLITDYPDSPYLKYKLAYLLTFMAIDKKKRNLGKHLDLKDLNYSNSYNTTLNLLWEMRFAEQLDLASHLLSDLTETDVQKNPHILAVEAIVSYYEMNIRSYQKTRALYKPITDDELLTNELLLLERELEGANNKRK
jgi:predicted Zn-dependent protease